MIITCPECTTRYDLDDDRFLPNGRSVRCTACGESWFVPAPEAIEDLTPADLAAPADASEDADITASQADADLVASRGRGRLNIRIEEDSDEAEAEKAGEDASEAAAATIYAGLPPRDEKGRFMSRAAREAAAKATAEAEASTAAQAPVEEIDDEDDDEDDDILFESPIISEDEQSADEDQHDEQDDDDEPPAGWRRGRQFYVRDAEPDDAEDVGPRAFFAKRRAEKEKAKQEAGRSNRDDARDSDRRASEERYGYDRRAPFGDDEQDQRARIVDADFEDIDGDTEISYGRNFGRRIRQERRRATALARMEDVRRFEPEMFDEEFFASLHVTPRELEHAVRKARRRAEFRDKNRMTPWRAFGWSAWVAAVAGAAYAVVAYRDEIVRAAPSAADAYAVVGIETEPFGLKIENVRHRLAMSTGGPIIEISGALRNVSEETLQAPLLQAEALGPRGELLSRWTFTPSATTVAGKGAVDFATRNLAPEGVAEVALTFAQTQPAISAYSAQPISPAGAAAAAPARSELAQDQEAGIDLQDSQYPPGLQSPSLKQN